jgi:hypothetical protein
MTKASRILIPKRTMSKPTAPTAALTKDDLRRVQASETKKLPIIIITTPIAAAPASDGNFWTPRTATESEKTDASDFDETLRHYYDEDASSIDSGFCPEDHSHQLHTLWDTLSIPEKPPADAPRKAPMGWRRYCCCCCWFLDGSIFFGCGGQTQSSKKKEIIHLPEPRRDIPATYACCAIVLTKS